MTEPTPNVTSLSGATWQELYGQDTKHRPGVMLEASRRVVKALEASEHSAASLGKRISWLNQWLLVFTVAIFALTAVLVWTALREVAKGYRQLAAENPASRDVGPWVLWSNTQTITRVNADGRLEYTWSTRLWEPTAAHTVRKECMEALDVLSTRWPEKPKVGDQRNTYSCLPDTVDPRGPKGK